MRLAVVAVVAVFCGLVACSPSGASFSQSPPPFRPAVASSPLAWFLARIEPWQTVVGARQFASYTLNLSGFGMGQPVKAQINLGSGDIGVSVTGPSGQSLVQPARVGNGYIVQFTSVGEGAYLFRFDNTYSLISNKQLLLRFVE